MTTLQLPEELVDTLQAEAQLAGKTLAEYLSLLLGRREEKDSFPWSPEIQSYLDEALQERLTGEHIPHEEVMRQMAKYLD